MDGQQARGAAGARRWGRVGIAAAVIAVGCTGGRSPSDVSLVASPAVDIGGPAPLGGNQCLAAGAGCVHATDCCSLVCAGAAKGTQAFGRCGALDQLGGGLARLTAPLKASDLRVTPPAIDDAGATRAQDGRALLTIRVAQDARVRDQLTFAGAGANGAAIVFHDDGLDGDAQAGDRVYTAASALSFDDLAKGENDFADLLARRGIKQAPIFRGRQQVGAASFGPTVDIDGHLHFRFPTGLLVDTARTLVITDPSVIGDHSRTGNACDTAAGGWTPMGVWSFGHLMTAMANQSRTFLNPSDLVLSWLQLWLTTQTFSPSVAAARPRMQGIIDSWPKLPGGRLDLARAPFRLAAIVNRIDLNGNPSYGRVGGPEGRFIFQLINPTSCTTPPFLIILEYGVPVNTCAEVRDWARAWLALQSLPLGSAAYNTALAALTETFAAANAAPSAPNGSALNQLRSNENAIRPAESDHAMWELREFRLPFSGTGASLLRQSTVAQTPDWAYNGNPVESGSRSAQLADWVNANQPAVIAGTYRVPPFLPAVPAQGFLGIATLNQSNPGITVGDCWASSGILSNEARHQLSLGTCNGCHGREAHAGATFIQIGSSFLAGPSTINDPVDGTPRAFNEPLRRAQALEDLASSSCDLVVGRIPPEIGHAIPLPPLHFRPTLQTD